MYPYKIFTWTITESETEIAPRLGIDVNQRWPYAPYHLMLVALQHAPRDAALFLCLAGLTLLALGGDLPLGRLALLGGLFALPAWALMAGGVPLPEAVTPAQFAEAQVKALPVLALLPLGLGIFVLRRAPRPVRWPAGLLTLLLMAVLMLANPLLELIPEEPKRRALQTAMQDGLVIYAALGLPLLAALRALLRRPATRLAQTLRRHQIFQRGWLRDRVFRRASAPQDPALPDPTSPGGADVQNEL